MSDVQNLRLGLAGSPNVAAELKGGIAINVKLDGNYKIKDGNQRG